MYLSYICLLEYTNIQYVFSRSYCVNLKHQLTLTHKNNVLKFYVEKRKGTRLVAWYLLYAQTELNRNENIPIKQKDTIV